VLEVNKIYCEDHLITMSKMPDDFVDLTVTSPPYDNLRDYKGYTFQFEKMAMELYRVTKPGGVLVWVVNDSTVDGSETLTSCKQKIFFREECGFNIHDTMIFGKDNPMPNDPKQNRYFQAFEFMFVMSKGLPNKCNYIKERCWNYGKRSGTGTARKPDGTFREDRKIKRKGAYCKYEKPRSNIWLYTIAVNITTKDILSYQHPAIFPEQLAADHIYSWSNEGDLVYDPMAGSGTVPKMAIKMKRKWIASEISQEYCDIAEKRIKREQSILKLF